MRSARHVTLAIVALWIGLGVSAPPVDARPHHGSDLCFGHRTTQFSGPGPQVLVGGPGRDILNSGSGNDVIVGRGGDDIVCGGPGNDVIVPGAGHDFTLGGSGHDVCVGVRVEARHDNVFGCDAP